MDPPPPPYSVVELLKQWREYATALEQVHAKDVKAEEVLRRWYLVVARKAVAMLVVQHEENKLRRRSPADQHAVVRVLVVESKNNVREVTEGRLVNPDHQLVKLLDSFTDLVKDRGAARRALKYVVGRGSAARQDKLEELEENFSIVSHAIGNLIARRVELEDVKLGFKELNDFLEDEGALGDVSPPHSTASNEPVPGVEVVLPYSWGLVEGQDRQVRLPPASTSVFEPVGRETAYSAAARVVPPPSIDRLLRKSWIPRRRIALLDIVSSVEATAMGLIG
ncbi:hypothetical protein JCM8208_002594 [Rhodotorula glutinis]